MRGDYFPERKRKLYEWRLRAWRQGCKCWYCSYLQVNSLSQIYIDPYKIFMLLWSIGVLAVVWAEVLQSRSGGECSQQCVWKWWGFSYLLIAHNMTYRYKICGLFSDKSYKIIMWLGINQGPLFWRLWVGTNGGVFSYLIVKSPQSHLYVNPVPKLFCD